jgi:ribonuclease P protein component
VQRLQTRAQFQAVLAGKTVARTRHFALHCAPLARPDAPQVAGVSTRATSPNPAADQDPQSLFASDIHWLGALTPKRSAKRAVTRNAIKRQIYTVSPDLIRPSPPAAYVVRLSAAFDKTLFPSASSAALKTAVREELQQLFTKAGLLSARPSALVTP